jgi:hypothetical protein
MDMDDNIDDVLDRNVADALEKMYEADLLPESVARQAADLMEHRNVKRISHLLTDDTKSLGNELRVVYAKADVYDRIIEADGLAAKLEQALEEETGEDDDEPLDF